jgi:hypothetical protein
MDAAVELQCRGFDGVYLILEDHIPFGVCNASYLNSILPETGERLHAEVVSLVGWDQYQARDGEYLGPDGMYWIRNAPAYEWKFSLHPAWWRIETLRALLESVKRVKNGVPVSAREVEAITRSEGWTPRAEWLSRTYRIHGDRSAAGIGWWQKRAVRMSLRCCINALRLLSRAVGGTAMRERLDCRWRRYTKYLNGAYPVYWSGLLQKGQIHDDAIKYLRMTRQHEILTQVRAILEATR